MNKNRMIVCGFCAWTLLAFSISATAWANNAPVVSNVTASQRGDGSKLVDIHYDLADAESDPCTVWVSVSDDNGANWRVPARTFTGDLGMGVSPGSAKAVVWDAGLDMPGAVGSNFKVRVWADDGNGNENMVLVPGGWFPYQNVGSPEQWVYVATFMIDKYEVTNQFYCQFLNNADPNGIFWHWAQEIDRWGDPGAYTYTVQAGMDNYPIWYVSAYDAEPFAAWRSAQSGQTYRLPTQHEWEKAAAWDPVENHYYLYGFHQDTISCPWCNYDGVGGGGAPYCNDGPLPVGSYDGTGGLQNAKSFYGCYDMSGNLWEWTSESSGPQRVSRGGAWNGGASNAQCASSDLNYPQNRMDRIGFRLVRSVP